MIKIPLQSWIPILTSTRSLCHQDWFFSVSGARRQVSKCDTAFSVICSWNKLGSFAREFCSLSSFGSLSDRVDRCSIDAAMTAPKQEEPKVPDTCVLVLKLLKWTDRLHDRETKGALLHIINVHFTKNKERIQQFSDSKIQNTDGAPDRMVSSWPFNCRFHLYTESTLPTPIFFVLALARHGTSCGQYGVLFDRNTSLSLQESGSNVGLDVGVVPTC